MADPAPLLAGLPRIAEEALSVDGLDARLTGADKPFVVRGLAAGWPLVQAGLASPAAASDYLKDRARKRNFPVNIGEPGGGERLFYDQAMGVNFREAQGPFPAILDGILANEDKRDAPVIYLSSIDIEGYFDGLGVANRLPLGQRQALESIWIGNRTRIAAHNDVPDNLAVCAVGRRRFTIFPPEQMANLYLGPLENTPAGRPVSMVDFAKPDLSAYPRFADALAQAQVAELEPGDAVFVPSLWWHHVEGLTPFNVLVNYWWRDGPAFLGHPEDALYHAILAIRDMPEPAKKRWLQQFEHYVFGDGTDPAAHLPDHAKGILGPLTAETAGQIKAKLLRGLSR
jgi:hypothetical protein